MFAVAHLCNSELLSRFWLSKRGNIVLFHILVKFILVKFKLLHARKSTKANGRSVKCFHRNSFESYNIFISF